MALSPIYILRGSRRGLTVLSDTPRAAAIAGCAILANLIDDRPPFGLGLTCLCPP